MVYDILQQVAKLCFAIYHRKVYFINRHNLPKDGPVLLCPNHPGAFFDACILGAYSKRHLYYLTRGDLFKGGLFEKLLVATHQIPIFRAADGMKNLRNNMETFTRCFDYLGDGRAVLIFPEARTELEKRLRPLHKGAARIALGTQEKYPGVFPTVVPVGVTFSEPREFGRDAYFNHGEPIDVTKFLELYEDDPQKAIQEITKAIEIALRDLMIYLDSREGEDLFDRLVVLIEPEPELFPTISDSASGLYWQKAVATNVNALSEAELRQAKSRADAIEAIGKGSGLSMHVLPQLARKNYSLLWILISWPVLFLGVVIEKAPVWFTYKFILSRVKRQPFIAPLKSILGFFTHAFYYLIIAIVLGVIWGGIGWLAGLVLLMIGNFALSQHRKVNISHWVKWQRMTAHDRMAVTDGLRDLKEQFGPGNDQGQS